jgi:hypothetical protein
MVKPKFVIAYPFGGRPVPVDWHISVRLMQLPTNTASMELFRRNMKLEDAQTSMAEQALDLGAEYVLFIEDDTQPPPHTIMALGSTLEQADADVMACGGIYTTRVPSPEPIVYMAAGQGAYWNWKIGQVFPCWSVGFGCMMLKTEIFKHMPKPWFKNCDTYEEISEFPELFPEIIEAKPKRCGVTTDLFFCTKLNKMGYRVLAHGGVLPVHWDVEKNLGYWLPKGCYPIKDTAYEGWLDKTLEPVCQ